MKYIIIGLGNYGSVLAEELTVLGHEVIGVDSDEGRVDAIKDKIATAFILDATDNQALQILPIAHVDVVIVAIGENFGASIKVVALLKMFKAQHIYARAVDDVHKSVLEAFSLDSILSPEKEAARSLVKLLDLNIHVESLQVDKEYYVMKFKIPASFVGVRVGATALEEEFNLKIIALLKGKKAHNLIDAEVLERTVDEHYEATYRLEPDDQLVCYGTYRNFMDFWRAV